MEGAGDFHHKVTGATAGEADAVLEHTAALDATVDMLDTHPSA
jgi:hypothetical protein